MTKTESKTRNFNPASLGDAAATLTRIQTVLGEVATSNQTLIFAPTEVNEAKLTPSAKKVVEAELTKLRHQLYKTGLFVKIDNIDGIA